LEHAIERAVTLSVSQSILPEDLTRFGVGARVPEAASQEPPVGADSGSTPRVVAPRPRSLESSTRQQILEALRETKGNKVRAAERLGIARWSLYRIARRLGVDLAVWEEGAGREAARETRDDLLENV